MGTVLLARSLDATGDVHCLAQPLLAGSREQQFSSSSQSSSDVRTECQGCILYANLVFGGGEGLMGQKDKNVHVATHRTLHHFLVVWPEIIPEYPSLPESNIAQIF